MNDISELFERDPKLYFHGQDDSYEWYQSKRRLQINPSGSIYVVRDLVKYRKIKGFKAVSKINAVELLRSSIIEVNKVYQFFCLPRDQKVLDRFVEAEQAYIEDMFTYDQEEITALCEKYHTTRELLKDIRSVILKNEKNESHRSMMEGIRENFTEQHDLKDSVIDNFLRDIKAIITKYSNEHNIPVSALNEFLGSVG